MTKRPHPESGRSLHGPLQSFDLEAEVTRLREEKAWQEGERLEEHSAPGPITLSVHDGRIRFSAADEDVEAGAGTVLACDAGVRHSVEALGEAVCLLNVATGSGRRDLG